MQTKRVLAVLIVFGGLLALPAPARADWFFTPYIGANFGGDAPDTSVNFGGSLGYMGAGVIGFEIDFGYAPDFTSGEFVDDFGTVFEGDGEVTSFMANLIVGAPIGGQGAGVRPYASAGAGLLRRRASVEDFEDFDVTSNDFGINVGAGVMGFFTDNVGLRGDVRYFRGFGDDEPGDAIDLELGDFDFWRASLGVAFRF
jgi:opacity protein-like surface antigen